MIINLIVCAIGIPLYLWLIFGFMGELLGPYQERHEERMKARRKDLKKRRKELKKMEGVEIE